MGKNKGKMSSADPGGKGKWARYESIRCFESALEEARSLAYVKSSLQRNVPARIPLQFPHLQKLLNYRIQDDRDEIRNPKKVFDAKMAEQSKRMRQMRQIQQERKNDGIKYRNMLTSQAETHFIIENEVPRLGLLCLKTIGQNLPSYSDNDLLEFAKFLRCDDTEYLSIVCAANNSITDDVIKMISIKNVKLLMLGAKVTSTGISKLLNSYDVDSDELCDEWEDFDPSTIQTLHLNSTIESIYLMGSNITLDSLVIIRTNIPNLCHFIIHNVSFENEVNISDEVTCCRNILEPFLTSFLSLQYLEFSFCDWLSVPALALWLQAICFQRQENNLVLPSLKCLKLVGFLSYKQKLRQLELLQSDWNHRECIAWNNFITECNELVQQFSDLAGIDLIFDS